MTILRTDQQVAINELLIVIKDTADHFHDAAEFLDDPSVTRTLETIAGERETLASRYEKAVRNLGDLPAGPDIDRETLERLAHRVGAAVSPDHVGEVISQRLAAENYLRKIIEQAKSVDLDGGCRALVADTAEHARGVRERLEQIKKNYSG